MMIWTWSLSMNSTANRVRTRVGVLSAAAMCAFGCTPSTSRHSTDWSAYPNHVLVEHLLLVRYAGAIRVIGDGVVSNGLRMQFPVTLARSFLGGDEPPGYASITAPSDWRALASSIALAARVRARRPVFVCVSLSTDDEEYGRNLFWPGAPLGAHPGGLWREGDYPVVLVKTSGSLPWTEEFLSELRSEGIKQRIARMPSTHAATSEP